MYEFRFSLGCFKNNIKHILTIQKLIFFQDSAGSESWGSYLGEIFCNALKESSLHVKIVEKLPSSFPTFVVDVTMFNDDGESANLKDWILNRLLLEVNSLPTTFGEFDQEFLSAEALNPFCEGYTGDSKCVEVENVEPAVAVNLLDKSGDEKINNLNFVFNKVSVKCLPNVKISEDLLPSPKTNLSEISSTEEISSSSGLSIDNKVETNSNKSSSTSNSSSVENNLSSPTEVFKPIHPAQPIPVVLMTHTVVPPQPVFNPNVYPQTPRPSIYHPPPAYYPPVQQFSPQNAPVHTGMPQFRPPFAMYQGNPLQQGHPMLMYNSPNWNQLFTSPPGFPPRPQNGKPPGLKAINSASLSTENQNLQFKGPDTRKSISSSNNTNARLNAMCEEFVPMIENAAQDQQIVAIGGVSQHSENQSSPNVSEHSNSSGTTALPAKGEV